MGHFFDLCVSRRGVCVSIVTMIIYDYLFGCGAWVDLEALSSLTVSCSALGLCLLPLSILSVQVAWPSIRDAGLAFPRGLLLKAKMNQLASRARRLSTQTVVLFLLERSTPFLFGCSHPSFVVLCWFADLVTHHGPQS
jgi:hypothetical protein